MCRIKLESVAENALIPLKKSMADTDPYVGETAALRIVKLSDVIPEAVASGNFLTTFSIFCATITRWSCQTQPPPFLR
jgi:hypothetical protein